MARFKLHPLAIAMAAATVIPAAYAQEVVEEELIVTGFRASVLNSLNAKKEQTSIVEVVSAEDIGKLPDTSIAESLARLPGLAGERRGGRTSGLSVRGFNENYVGTTMNGRELLGIGDNRGVEYDLYPSEIISSAVVYKTPSANLLTQGIGGTVDLRTIRPLDSDRIVAVNATYEQNAMDAENPDYDNTGHRLSFTFSDKFADDTIGIALAVATMESPSQEEQFRAWGYTDGSIGGHDSFVRSALMERDTFSGVVQFQPTDRLNITVDALVIDFNEQDIKRGLEEALSPVLTTVAAGRVVAGQIGTVDADNNGVPDGFNPVIRNDGQTKESNLSTFGVNVDFQVSDVWSLGFDLSSGTSEKDLFDIESYSGTGRPAVQYVLDDDGNFTFAEDEDGNPTAQPVTVTYAGGLTADGDPEPPNARAFRMTSNGISFSSVAGTPNYADPNVIRLAGPQAWGGSLAPISAFAPTYVNGVDGDGNPIAPDLDDQLRGPGTAQDGFINNSRFEEELTSVKLSLNGALEFGIISDVELGVNYSDRKKTKVNDGAFLTAPTWPLDGPIPESAVLGAIRLDHIGGVEILGYDSMGLYESGYYTTTTSNNLETGRLGDTYEVNEEVVTVFGQANLAAEMGTVNFTGNIGLQVVSVDQESSGFSTSIGEDRFVDAVPVSGGDSFTKFLPSLNMNFEITEDFFIRTSMAKVVSRPRMDDLRPNRLVSFQFNDFNIQNTNPELSAWSGSSGNAQLSPLEANQYDLAYDWYFADEGVVSVAFFYKDLVNWTVGGSTIEDFTDFYIEGYTVDTNGADPATFLGQVSSREDGLEGYVQGTELQAVFPMHVISESLDGFGLMASATFSQGQFDNGDGIPGLSEEIFQFTAYYQRAGFEIRVSGRKRDEFVSEVRGISLSLVDSVDTGAELWDAQIGYDFAESGISGLEGLSFSLQAQNITDEDTILVDEDDPRLVTQYQSFGANYLLGVNYKF